MKTIKHRIEKKTFVCLLVILTLGVLLRLYKIGADNLWLDEVMSLNIASRADILDILKASLSDNHPPLYHILLHYWIAIAGMSELSVRIPSFIFGVVSIFLIYLLTIKLTGKREALIAALLLAISPFHIWYSQEGRMFSLHIMIALISNIFLIDIINGKTQYRWTGFIAASVLNMYTFVYSAFILLFQNIFIIIYRIKNRGSLREGDFLKWIAAQLVILVLYLPNPVFRLYNRYINSEDNFKIVDVRHPAQAISGVDTSVIPYTLFTFSVGFSIGPSTHELHTREGREKLGDHIVSIGFIFSVFLYLFVYGLHRLRSPMTNLCFLSLYIFIPIFMAIIFSMLLGIRFHVRYISAVLPAYLIVLSIGIYGSKKNLFLSFIFCIELFSLSNFYLIDRYRKEDIRSAASLMDKVTDKDHAVLLIGARRAFEYYFHGSAKIIAFSRDEVNNARVLTEKLKKIETNFDQIWIIISSPWRVDPENKIFNYFKIRYKHENHLLYNRVGIFHIKPEGRY